MSDNLSENSVMKSDIHGDIHAKYNRLAAEYSKLREQNKVLKKAVVDEQMRNTELNEKLRSKEQLIRRSNLEMEALNFRNSQLTVRITVLQEEIDSINNKNGKKKSKHPPDIPNGTASTTFLDAEIEKTMMENVKLISQLSGKDEKYQEEISLLKKQISALNYELDQSSVKLKQILEEHKITTEELKKEQQELKRDYASKIVKLKETEVELSTLKNVHKSYVDEVRPKLEVLMLLLPKKMPFSDEEHAILNKLNVRYVPESNDESMQIKPLQKCFAALLLTFYNIIHNVTLELRALGFEELKIYIRTLFKEDDGLQLSEKLNACYQLLKNIGLDSSIPDSMEFAVYQFIRCFLDLSYSIDSSYMNKSGRLKSDDLVHHISGVSVKENFETFHIRKNELVEKIITLPNSQHALIHEEFENLNAAIKNLISAIDDIDHKRLQSSVGNSADTYEFKKKATTYLRSLRKDPTERIPYEEALENKCKLQEYIMINNALQGELQKLEDIVTSLEQEKIRLQNECQIMEKKNSNPLNFSSQVEDGPFELENELGTFTSPYHMAAEILAQGKEMQRYMNEKVNEIVACKEEAFGKARTFMLECKALQRRLENCAVEKQLLENRYLKSNHTVLELREELSTISQNYEAQLSTMSDHLASVNEKLASQTEEIDNLHYQINNKTARKNKQK